MIDTSVLMRKEGCFDLPVGKSTWRVLHEERFDGDRPWVLVAFDASSGLSAADIAGNLGEAVIGANVRGSGGLAVYDSYESLDGALEALVEIALGEREEHRFRVEMPCGNSFIRPGKVPAEQVITRLGWVHLRRLRGYMMITLPENACPFRARDGFRQRLAIPGAKLGESTRVSIGGGSSNWCADVFIDCERFARMEEIQEIAAAAFDAVGEMLPHYDFVPRTPVFATAAQVLQFPARKAA